MGSVLRDIRHQGIRIVPQHQTRDRYLVAVKPTRRIAVLNLRRPEIGNIVITGKRSPRLSAAPYYQYDQTRKWAQPVRSLLQREAARVGASVDFEETPSIPDSAEAPHVHSNQK